MSNDELELPEPVGWYDSDNQDYSRVRRVGWSALFTEEQYRAAILADRERVRAANTSAGCVKESAESEHERAQAAEPVDVNETVVGERQTGLARASESQRAAEPVGEVVLEDMGRPFSAAQARVHFHREVPPPGTKLYTHPARPALTEDQILARGWYHFLPAGEETGLDADDYEIHDARGFNSGLPPCPECIPCLIVRDAEKEAALGGGDD